MDKAKAESRLFDVALVNNPHSRLSLFKVTEDRYEDGVVILNKDVRLETDLAKDELMFCLGSRKYMGIAYYVQLYEKSTEEFTTLPVVVRDRRVVALTPEAKTILEDEKRRAEYKEQVKRMQMRVNEEICSFYNQLQNTVHRKMEGLEKFLKTPILMDVEVLKDGEVQYKGILLNTDKDKGIIMKSNGMLGMESLENIRFAYWNWVNDEYSCKIDAAFGQVGA